MAIPQGNFVALQALQPTQYKTGDLYLQMQDYLIKKGEAEKAAKLKVLQDQKKSMWDMIGKEDPKIFTTLQSFQPQTNKLFENVLNYKDQAQRAIENDSLSYDEKLQYISKAKNAQRDYELLSTIMANTQFLESNKKINDQIRSGDYFKGDKNLGLYASINSGFAKLGYEPDGNMYVYYNPDVNRTDHDALAEKIPLTEATAQLTSGLEKDLTPQIDNDLQAFKKTTKTGSTIGNGVTTVSSDKVVFDTATNRNSIIGYFGFDTSKPLSEQFTNINALSPQARQYFYEKNNRHIKDGKDIESLINQAVNYAKGFADTSSDYKRTVQLRNNNNGGGNSSSQGSGFISTLDNGDSYVQVKDVSGNILGVQNWNINSVSLPKIKGMPTSDNQFGFSQFKNKKGQLVDYWLIGAPAKDGRTIYSTIPEKDFGGYVSKLGYNPIVVKQALLQKERQVNLYRNSMMKYENNIYRNTQIYFKTKDYSNPEDNTGLSFSDTSK